MSKYYLNVSINDKPILTITSGELKKIDKFIIKNNICNVEQLYNHIKDDIKLDLNNDSVEFTIDYKHGGEIKNKPLFYKNELLEFKKCDNKDSYIYELLKRDKDFKNKFDSKYINSLIYMKKKTKVLDNAYDYLHEFSSKTFSKLYFSLVSRKKENDIKNKSFENFEDLEAALEERKYSYTKEREIYFMAYFWRKLYPNNKLIVNNSEIIDEFDEQRKYGLNTLERLKVNGISYDKFMEMQEQIIDDYNNENNDYIEKNEKNNVKKKVKRIKKQDSSQFSFFDKE